ncbi:hypothetical protein MP228_008079 [Amoeboaphelidium protococcarum]|nr:hypothetical protein MP228_008079 [Amoeboaphelidium protococcarum]
MKYLTPRQVLSIKSQLTALSDSDQKVKAACRKSINSYQIYIDSLLMIHDTVSSQTAPAITSSSSILSPSSLPSSSSEQLKLAHNKASVNISNALGTVDDVTVGNLIHENLQRVGGALQQLASVSVSQQSQLEQYNLAQSSLYKQLLLGYYDAVRLIDAYSQYIDNIGFKVHQILNGELSDYQFEYQSSDSYPSEADVDTQLRRQLSKGDDGSDSEQLVDGYFMLRYEDQSEFHLTFCYLDNCKIKACRRLNANDSLVIFDLSTVDGLETINSNGFKLKNAMFISVDGNLSLWLDALQKVFQSSSHEIQSLLNSSSLNRSLSQHSYGSSGSKGSGALMVGYLSSSKDLSKNSTWKQNRYRLLKDQTLVLAGDEASYTIVADLSKLSYRTAVQPVDESICKRRLVFSIRLSKQKCLYFAAADTSSYRRWILALKCAVGPSIQEQKIRAVKSLHLRLVEAKGIPVQSEVYLMVHLNDELICQSNVRKNHGGNPFWREDFYFDDIEGIQFMRIALMQKHKINKDSEYGSILLSNIQYGEADAWYSLNSLNSSSSSSSSQILSASGDSLSSGANLHSSKGQMKLYFVYKDQLILPLQAYKCYLDLLLDTKTSIVYPLSSIAADLEKIAEILLGIHCCNQQAIKWITQLISNEVENTENMNVLFRGNSLLTKALDAYMKLIGSDYLRSTLGSILNQICVDKVYIELDSTRLGDCSSSSNTNDDTDAKQMLDRCYRYAQSIWVAIRDSVPNMPIELRVIFNYIQQSVMKRFGTAQKQYNPVVYTSVSGFIFLRLYCPAILNPKLFNLTRDYPDQRTTRSLTLLAKIMQCLANLANFGVKEPYMLDMNMFIMENSSQVMEFIDEISTLPPGMNFENIDKNYGLDQERYLARFHQYLIERKSTFDAEPELKSIMRHCDKVEEYIGNV